MRSHLIVNIGDLVTCSPLTAAGGSRLLSGITDRDLGRTGPGAWLAVVDGRVAASGTGSPPQLWDSLPRLDAGGGLVLPGLIDCHTHPVFAGSRANEFAMRLAGATYQEIAAKGGGIRSTMNHTRTAGDAILRDGVLKRLEAMLRWGVTTAEVKTGYGLSVPEELRHLRILQETRQHAAQTLSVTCLALHAASPEYAGNTEWVQACVSELLPEIAAEGLADSVDAFIEAGYFSVRDVEPWARKAKDLGLMIRLHADEFSDAGAAAAAAEWQASSADHLQFAAAAGIRSMGRAGTIATLLPGTSLFTGIPFTKAQPFREAGVPLAVATDFNPGSCNIHNLPMMAALAAVHAGLSPAEAVAGVTAVPAAALGLSDRKGALQVGFDADLALFPQLSAEDWLYDFGQSPAVLTMTGGILRKF